MISSKYLHDDGEEDEVFADEWARSGDLTVPELCQLEKEFLNAIVSCFFFLYNMKNQLSISFYILPLVENVR